MNQELINTANFDDFLFFFDSLPSNATASAGLIVSATSREESNVTVIIKGIEKIYLPIIQVINNIAEKIYTTVRVVENNTFL